MEIEVRADSVLAWDGRELRCSLGPAGVTCFKREGDGATPAGDFPLRRVLFRKDRLAAPATRLPVAPIGRDDGWCDDPGDANYNRQVRLPYSASAERLWRADGVYDVLVVLGHNDDPVVPGAGSAIFLHVARPDFGPTEGCIAVALPDLLRLLGACGPETRIRVKATPGRETG